MQCLEGHIPTDAQERDDARTIATWLQSAENPLDRTNYSPGHAVGSAFVVSTDGRLALVFHGQLKRWLQPGGHATPAESDLALVAAREAAEELGLDVNPRRLRLFDVEVQTIPSSDRAPSHLHFDIRFVTVHEPRELTAADDAAAARWFTYRQASKLALDRGLERMIAKAHELHLVVLC